MLGMLWKCIKPLKNKDVTGPNKRLIMDQLPVLEAQVRLPGFVCEFVLKVFWKYLETV